MNITKLNATENDTPIKIFVAGLPPAVIRPPTVNARSIPTPIKAPAKADDTRYLNVLSFKTPSFFLAAPVAYMFLTTWCFWINILLNIVISIYYYLNYRIFINPPQPVFR